MNHTLDIKVVVQDLLDATADCMLCTANPWLNMSGGVNAAILGRGNMAIQRELHAHIAARPVKYVDAESVVETSTGDLNVDMLLHCVAIDGFYHSDSAMITRVVDRALTLAAQRGCETVVMPTLATGYGPLSMRQFALGLRPLLARSYAPITDLTVHVLKQRHADEITEALRSA